jgi:broad specificity phosphatase PhoE
MADLILVRHGETQGESSIRLYGSTDIELSETGREQMKRAGEALSGIAFRSVASSPLKRSREGAAIVSARSGVEPVAFEGLREIDFGLWEGWSLAEAEARDPLAYNLWKTTGTDFAFPGGESKKRFFSRVASAAVEIFPSLATPALAVLHKGVIKGVLAGLAGVDPVDFADYPVELGSIFRLEYNDGSWKVVSSNETAHLRELRISGSA